MGQIRFLNALLPGTNTIENWFRILQCVVQVYPQLRFQLVVSTKYTLHAWQRRGLHISSTPPSHLTRALDSGATPATTKPMNTACPHITVAPPPFPHVSVSCSRRRYSFSFNIKHRVTGLVVSSHPREATFALLSCCHRQQAVEQNVFFYKRRR